MGALVAWRNSARSRSESGRSTSNRSLLIWILVPATRCLSYIVTLSATGWPSMVTTLLREAAVIVALGMFGCLARGSRDIRWLRGGPLDVPWPAAATRMAQSRGPVEGDA
jgi:hypothetical protein